MIEAWMERRFGSDVKSEKVRGAYGKAASVVGVFANVLLFAGKLIVGTVSGSVAITADAVNNLSDASSNIVSLLGFKLADKPADEDHPYGHGRYEYLSGLMVAVMILVIGVELMQGSIEKILHPTAVALSLPTVIVLVGSIAVKLWMSVFNRKIGRKIDSQTLIATADDSRNDVISTSVVLLSTVIGHFTGLMLDGWMGATVALFILISGFGLVRDTIDPMLGTAPTSEQVEAIRQKLESYPGVLGTHDLMVHDYGPGRQFASVHLEMDAKADPLDSHDLIDNIERDFLREQNLHLVIHYDPVTMDDPRVALMRTKIMEIVRGMHDHMTIHDLRIVPGNTHTNIVFDCVVPYDCRIPGKEIRERICQEVCAQYPNYYCVITLENSFVHQE
ncbi:MAG: cation transporter [Clostridia bacterium]|nr:cation transporter [Clostridia bacterium]